MAENPSVFNVLQIHVGKLSGLSWNVCPGAVLGWHLREGGINAETLKRYNAERAPRVREVLTKVMPV